MKNKNGNFEILAVTTLLIIGNLVACIKSGIIDLSLVSLTFEICIVIGAVFSGIKLLKGYLKFAKSSNLFHI